MLDPTETGLVIKSIQTICFNMFGQFVTDLFSKLAMIFEYRFVVNFLASDICLHCIYVIVHCPSVRVCI